MKRVGFNRMVLLFGAFLLAVAIDIVATSAPLALHTMILRGQFRLSMDFLDRARIIVDSLERSEDIRTIRMKNVSIDFQLDRPEIEQLAAALNQSMETSLAAGLRFDLEAWVGCMHSDEWKEKLGGFVRKERKS